MRFCYELRIELAPIDVQEKPYCKRHLTQIQYLCHPMTGGVTADPFLSILRGTLTFAGFEASGHKDMVNRYLL
jgi:hypothetical protein